MIIKTYYNKNSWAINNRQCLLNKVCTFEPLCEFARSRGNHPQQVSCTFCLFSSCFVNLTKIQSGFESFIKNKNNCKPAQTLTAPLRLHRHLFSSRQTPTWPFQPNTWQTHTTGLNTFELVSNCRTVTAIACITPGKNGSVFQNCSKGLTCRLNLLYTFELISNCRTVTAVVCMTPGHD